MSKSERITIDITTELREIYKQAMGMKPFLLGAYDADAVGRAIDLIRSQREEIARLRARVEGLEGGKEIDG